MGHDTSKPEKKLATIHFGGEDVIQEIITANYKDDELNKDQIFNSNQNKKFGNLEFFKNLISFNLEFSHLKLPYCLTNSYKPKSSNTKDEEFRKMKPNTFQLVANIEIKDFEDIQNIPYTRIPIDIVCVVDRSYSMKGEKIEFVKKSLMAFLEFLEPTDRISFIVFDDTVSRLCPLSFATEENKNKLFKKLINGIKPVGGTNIGKATHHAVEILKQRRNPNNVGAILLLSDGVDSRSDVKIKNLISKERHFFKEPLVIHTFGYGQDHDPIIMNNIAEVGNGSFFFIDNKKLDIVLDCLVSCLGNLVNIVAQNVVLNISTNEDYFSIKKLYGAKFDYKVLNEKESDFICKNIVEEDNFSDIESYKSSKSKSTRFNIQTEREQFFKDSNINVNINQTEELLIKKTTWGNVRQITLPNLVGGRSYNFVYELEFCPNKKRDNDKESKNIYYFKYTIY